MRQYCRAFFDASGQMSHLMTSEEPLPFEGGVETGQAMTVRDYVIGDPDDRVPQRHARELLDNIEVRAGFSLQFSAKVPLGQRQIIRDGADARVIIDARRLATSGVTKAPV